MRWNEGRVGARSQLVGKYDVLDHERQRLQQRRRLPDHPALPKAERPPAGCDATIAATSLRLCGEQKTWIIGVNWYLNDYVRLMFDYAEADLSGYPLTAITAARHPDLPPGNDRRL